jgi:MHS family metabolite:H+ symporter-like MFS transporter
MWYASYLSEIAIMTQVQPQRTTSDLVKAAVSGWLGTALEFMDFKFYRINALKQKGITRLLKLHGALMGQTHSILSSEALPAHRYFLTSISRKPGKPSAHQRDPFAKQ